MRDTPGWSFVRASSLVVAALALLSASACGDVGTADLEDSDVGELRAFLEGTSPLPDAAQRDEHRHTFARQAVRASGMRRAGAELTMESEGGWSPVAEQDGQKLVPGDPHPWQISGDFNEEDAFVPLRSQCAAGAAELELAALPDEVRGPDVAERAARLACAIERLDGRGLPIVWAPRLSHGLIVDPGQGAVLVNPRLIVLVEGKGESASKPVGGVPLLSGGEGETSSSNGPVASGDPGKTPQDLDDNDHHPRPPTQESSGSSRTWCDRACDDVWNDACDCNSSPGAGSSNNCDCGSSPGSNSGCGSSACDCAHAHHGARDQTGIFVSLLFAGTLALRRGVRLRARRGILPWLLGLLLLLGRAASASAAPPPKLVDVHVAVTPPEAVVFVDGDAVTPANGVVRVTPGTHIFSAQLDGYAQAVQTTSVPERGTGTLVTLRLTADKGYLIVTGSNPALVIALDGTPVGKGSYSGLVVPGKHIVTAYVPGGESRSFAVESVAGQSASVSVDGPATYFPPAVAPPPAVQGPVAPPKKEPDRPRFVQTGIYGLVNVTLLWQTARPYGFEHGDTPAPGFAIGGRFGYRVSSTVGLEALLEYGRIANGGSQLQTYAIDQNGDGAVSGGESATDRSPADYTLESLRIGPLLRLMSPGRENRFVSGIGIGAIHDTVGLNHADLIWNASTSRYTSAGTYRHHYEGWSPYFLLEAGYERSIGRVLAGLVFQLGIDSVSGIDEAPYNTSVQARFGLVLRGGYAAW